jgi:hypothetical protein
VYQILHELDIEILLRLRLALDMAEPYQDIDQDIKDLYAYPERLNFTYPEEWKIAIRQQLTKRDISEQTLCFWLDLKAEEAGVQIPINYENLPHHLRSQAQLLIRLLADSHSRFMRAKIVLSDVLMIESAPEVSPLVPTLKRQLTRLLDD